MMAGGWRFCLSAFTFFNVITRQLWQWRQRGVVNYVVFVLCCILPFPPFSCSGGVVVAACGNLSSYLRLVCKAVVLSYHTCRNGRVAS